MMYLFMSWKLIDQEYQLANKTDLNSIYILLRCGWAYKCCSDGCLTLLSISRYYDLHRFIIDFFFFFFFFFFFLLFFSSFFVLFTLWCPSLFENKLLCCIFHGCNYLYFLLNCCFWKKYNTNIYLLDFNHTVLVADISYLSTFHRHYLQNCWVFSSFCFFIHWQITSDAILHK